MDQTINEYYYTHLQHRQDAGVTLFHQLLRWNKWPKRDDLGVAVPETGAPVGGGGGGGGGGKTGLEQYVKRKEKILYVMIKRRIDTGDHD